MGSAIYLEHALTPKKREVIHVSGKTIRELEPSWDIPFVALVDGQPVLRKDWAFIIIEIETVVFVDVRALPAGGGGGSNPVRMIAMLAVVALSVAAPYLAPAAWGLTTVTATGVTVAAGWGAAALSAGVMMLGSALVNALIPASPVSASSSSQASLAASPTYDLQAQGNQARLEGAIPEQFGRMLSFPDFGAQPYMEYAGNEQFLYCFYCVSRGHLEIEQLRIADTPLSNFSDVEYEIIGPGETLDLFPASVVTNEEVAGQDIVYNTWSIEVTTNNAGTSANYIGFDFVCARGLYYANDNGGYDKVSISVQAQLCKIDDNGVETGSWTTVLTKTYSGSILTPQRFSERVQVSPGRYKARVMRTSTEQTDTRYGNDIAWAGLRAYLKDTRTFGDTTCIALKIRASSQLTSMSSRKFNVISTRKLPIWNGSSWSAPVATRSIAWAAAYMLKEIGLSDSETDLEALFTYEVTWASRGDQLNGRFDTFYGAWEALTQAVQAGRAKPYHQAGIVRFFRDQADTMPVQLFTMRNISKDSFSIRYIMPSSDTSDSVSVSYFDATVWKNRRVLCKISPSTGAKPSKVDLFGVTSRAQAFKEGLYQCACNSLRRKIISFSTEMEGLLLSYGDLIAIQHDMPAFGQHADVVAWNPISRILALSEPLVWNLPQNHYIAIRDTKGRVVGPYLCTQGQDDYTVILSQDPIDQDGVAFSPYVGNSMERSFCSFGWGDTVYQLARVIGVTSRESNKFDIVAVNEDPGVHVADMGQTVPSPQVSQLGGFQAAPNVKGLLLRSMAGNPETMLISWEPAPWADSYIVEISNASDMKNWTHVANPSAAACQATAVYGSSTVVRVAAIGYSRGEWSYAYYSETSEYAWTNDAALAWTTDTALAWRY